MREKEKMPASILYFSDNTFYLYRDKSAFNCLTDDKILDQSKLKAYADDYIKTHKMMTFVCDTIENIVEKGENAGNQHFPLFPQCLHKVFHTGSLKVGIVW